MKNLPNQVGGTEEENQLDQSMKNLPTLMGDRGGKPTDFQEAGSDLFRPFISAVLGWLASLFFGDLGRLDGRPSHERSGVNRGGGCCRLGGVLLMKLAKQLSKMLYCRGWFLRTFFFWIAFPVD